MISGSNTHPFINRETGLSAQTHILVVTQPTAIALTASHA
jgi:hypothetical protein